jgi:hypothetical protein
MSSTSPLIMDAIYRMMGMAPKTKSPTLLSGLRSPAAPAAPPPALGSAALNYFKNRPQAGLQPLRPSPQPGQDLAAAEAWKSRYGSYPSWFKG